MISEDNLTIDSFKTILDAVHQNSVDSYTPYSNLFNPINQMAYFYYASQFSETVQLNLTYELSLGTHEYLLCDLVSEETHENGLKYHQDFIIRANMMRGLLIAEFSVFSSRFSVFSFQSSVFSSWLCVSSSARVAC